MRELTSAVQQYRMLMRGPDDAARTELKGIKTTLPVLNQNELLTKIGRLYEMKKTSLKNNNSNLNDEIQKLLELAVERYQVLKGGETLTQKVERVGIHGLSPDELRSHKNALLNIEIESLTSQELRHLEEQIIALGARYRSLNYDDYMRMSPELEAKLQLIKEDKKYVKEKPYVRPRNT